MECKKGPPERPVQMVRAKRKIGPQVRTDPSLSQPLTTATNRGGGSRSQAIFRLLRRGLNGTLHRSLNGSLHRALRNDHFTTAAAAAAVAAVATAVMATIAPMATITPVAAVAAVAATVTTTMAAVAAIAAVAVAAISAIAEEQAGLGLLLTADQGNPDQGEKQSNTENNNAVHPRILQLLTGTVS